MASTVLPIPTETGVINGPGSGEDVDPDVAKVLAAIRKDRNFFLMREPWANYLTNTGQSISVSANRVGSVGVSAQNASIGTTSIPAPELSSGLYLVSYYARITTAAGVSSSLTVAISFTDDGTTQTFSGTAMTGNTITTIQSNTWLLSVDAATPVTYAVSYASNPAGAMVYKLLLTLSAVQL